MAKLFWDIREEHELMEKLRASDPTGKWVSDFVHSDNPKFAGKSKKERIRMALGASYAAKRQNEDVEQVDEINLKPEHRAAIRKLRPSGEHSKTMLKHDSGKQIHVTREGDKVHLVTHEIGAGTGKKTTVNYSHFDEAAWGQDKMANLKAAHDRHSEKAIAANRAGDDQAVKVHQSKMNMIKNQMNRLRKEEVEQVHEAKHRVSVTVSEPDHAMVSKRKEQQQKFVRVSGEKEGAVARAQQHFKKQGYKIHGAEYVGGVNEDIEQVDELRTSTLLRYATKANKALVGGDRNKEEKRIKGIQKANYKIQTRHSVKEDAAQVDETPAYTKDDAYSGFGSIKPHRTLKVANVLKPEKDATARAERLMSKAGVRTNEAKSLSDYHQELRKKSGLPDPSYYLKRMKEKQAEIEALRNQGDQGSTERLHGISHDAHPGAQKTFAGQVKK